jgi:hypothetical protein
VSNDLTIEFEKIPKKKMGVFGKIVLQSEYQDEAIPLLLVWSKDQADEDIRKLNRLTNYEFAEDLMDVLAKVQTDTEIPERNKEVGLISSSRFHLVANLPERIIADFLLLLKKVSGQ